MHLLNNISLDNTDECDTDFTDTEESKPHIEENEININDSAQMSDNCTEYFITI